MLILLVGFVVLSNVYYASAVNELDYNGSCIKDSYSNMEPSFSLAARIDKPVINKGDTIKFEVYISGYGHVTNLTKIYASLPIRLVDDNTTFGSGYYIGFSNNTRNLKDLTKYNFLLNTPNAFYVYFPNDYFNQIFESNCYTILTFTEMNYPISGEMVAPILININTSKNAPDGDNKINLILTYSDGKNWYQDKQEVSFHINSWQEQHYYQYAGLIALIGALVVAIASFIWNIVAKRVNRPKERQKGSVHEHFHDGHWHPISKKHGD